MLRSVDHAIDVQLVLPSELEKVKPTSGVDPPLLLIQGCKKNQKHVLFEPHPFPPSCTNNCNLLNSVGVIVS